MALPGRIGLGALAPVLVAIMLAAGGCGGERARPAATGRQSSVPPTRAGAGRFPLVTPSPASVAAVTTYRVRAGDALSAISRRFGTTVPAIAAANHLSDPNRIQVGETLIIPGASLPLTSEPPSLEARVIRRGDPSSRAVALTFDAGSDTGFALQILDTLRANGVVASFGITGQWAERNPELLRRIVREGHQLINHTYDHASFTGRSARRPGLTEAQRWDELDRTEKIIATLTGASTKPFFRPPYGDYDDSVNSAVYARGYSYNVMWTVDSQGWTGLSADAIVRRCLAQAQPGAIYLFHLGATSQDAAALQRIIDGLHQQGFGFLTVDAFVPP